jgi:hypothetical protein
MKEGGREENGEEWWYTEVADVRDEIDVWASSPHRTRRVLKPVLAKAHPLRTVGMCGVYDWR